MPDMACGLTSIKSQFQRITRTITNLFKIPRLFWLKIQKLVRSLDNSFLLYTSHSARNCQYSDIKIRNSNPLASDTFDDKTKLDTGH